MVMEYVRVPVNIAARATMAGVGLIAQKVCLLPQRSFHVPENCPTGRVWWAEATTTNVAHQVEAECSNAVRTVLIHLS